jgi:hypothetical protein
MTCQDCPFAGFSAVTRRTANSGYMEGQWAVALIASTCTLELSSVLCMCHNLSERQRKLSQAHQWLQKYRQQRKANGNDWHLESDCTSSIHRVQPSSWRALFVGCVVSVLTYLHGIKRKPQPVQQLSTAIRRVGACEGLLQSATVCTCPCGLRMHSYSTQSRCSKPACTGRP